MATSNRRGGPHLTKASAAAREAFEERYGTDLLFAPVLVVIAA